MAIVNGPLFSLDASGKVGDALVFTKWKGRNVVRSYVTPANPRSLAQRARRTMMAILVDIWQGMDSTDKDSWQDLAIANNYSTFNGMTSYNLDEQTLGNPPTKNRSDTPTVIAAGSGSLSSTVGTNRIELTGGVDIPGVDTYMLFSLIEGSSAPGTASLNQIVGFGPAEVTGPVEITVSDLPAGTYSAANFFITNDGSISGIENTETNIVVPGTA